MQAVAGMDDATLQEHLSHLVDAELLFQQGSFPSSTYVFKHALVQDAAYQSLLRATRRRFHQSIADSLADRFPELRQTQPDLLAHHFTEAGNVGRAVEFHVVAGDRAVALSGTVEAITHYQRALALLEGAPADVEPERREMEVQTRLGDVLSSAQGYGAPDVATAYRRAEALAERVGDAPRLFEILHGIFRFHHTRAELDISLDLGERMVERAKHQGTQERVEAASSIGNAHWARGEFAEGIRYVEEALAEDLEERGEPRYTGPPVVTAEGVRDFHHRCVVRTTTGLLLTHLGHLDRAMGLADEALAMSRDAALPYSEAWVLYNKCQLHFTRREQPAVAECAGQLMAVSQSHGYFFITLGMVLSGWAMANGEDPASRADGIALALQGLDTFRSLGARLSQTMYLTAFAEAHLASGDTPLAQSSLDEAAMAIEITGERLWLPELHRVRGDMALRAERIDDAESQYREAMTIAQRQSNRLLEVRAAVALARCLESRGDGAAAREALQPAVARFPEDASVPDLRDAAALLAQLPVSS
jgi:tetratricopeptide (TPR) repeat protein